MKATVLWVVVASLGLGCSSSDGAAGNGRRAAATDTSREPRATAMPHETCVQGGNGEGLDVNGDGQVDVRTVMAGGRPQCRETDANFDGRIDIYRWFDASGNVTRVEDDYDFDGRIDVVATYQGGVVSTDVLDTNFDGRTDTWRDYQGGRVSELRRDADGDGRVDTWERFDGEGRLTYAAVDANHDGQPDQDVADAGTATAPADAGSTVPTAPAAPSADGGVR